MDKTIKKLETEADKLLARLHADPTNPNAATFAKAAAELIAEAGAHRRMLADHAHQRSMLADGVQHLMQVATAMNNIRATSTATA